MKRIEIEGIEIYIEHKPRNKNSYIRIKADGSVHLKTPMRFMWRIKKLLQERMEWIKAKRSDIIVRPKIAHEYGKTILFQGNLRPIETVPLLQQMMARLQTDDERSLQRCYERFYLKAAQLELPLHVNTLSQSMQQYPKSLHFRKMKRRWGSCNTQGVITLNTYLMQLDIDLIHYVIAHELCHLQHMNHSRDFYNLLHTYLPEGPSLRQRLRMSML